MKKCYHCGTAWKGYGAQPRLREKCECCERHFHCCGNCHHFGQRERSCRLEESTYIGSRETLNYCELFKMVDTVTLEAEARVTRARDRWESLFKR